MTNNETNVKINIFLHDQTYIMKGHTDFKCCIALFTYVDNNLRDKNKYITNRKNTENLLAHFDTLYFTRSHLDHMIFIQTHGYLIEERLFVRMYFIFKKTILIRINTVQTQKNKND